MTKKDRMIQTWFQPLADVGLKWKWTHDGPECTWIFIWHPYFTSEPVQGVTVSLKDIVMGYEVKTVLEDVITDLRIDAQDEMLKY
jgi:hypothetical protein